MMRCRSWMSSHLAHRQFRYEQFFLWPRSPDMTPWFLHRAHFGMRPSTEFESRFIECAFTWICRDNCLTLFFETLTDDGNICFFGKFCYNRPVAGMSYWTQLKMDTKLLSGPKRIWRREIFRKISWACSSDLLWPTEINHRLIDGAREHSLLHTLGRIAYRPLLTRIAMRIPWFRRFDCLYTNVQCGSIWWAQSTDKPRLTFYKDIGRKRDECMHIDIAWQIGSFSSLLGLGRMPHIEPISIGFRSLNVTYHMLRAIQ